MVNFILIGIILLIVIFLAFKMNAFRTKLAYLFIIMGVFFLLLTGYIIFSGKQINLTTVDGISSALKTYVSWLGTAGSNIVKVGGYAVKQDWKEKGNETS